MAKAEIRVTVDASQVQQLIDAVQWFAGRLTAAADELQITVDALTDTAEPRGNGESYRR